MLQYIISQPVGSLALRVRIVSIDLWEIHITFFSYIIFNHGRSCYASHFFKAIFYHTTRLHSISELLKFSKRTGFIGLITSLIPQKLSNIPLRSCNTIFMVLCHKYDAQIKIYQFCKFQKAFYRIKHFM
jgi:hypothetical protein